MNAEHPQLAWKESRRGAWVQAHSRPHGVAHTDPVSDPVSDPVLPPPMSRHGAPSASVDALAGSVGWIAVSLERKA